MSKVKEKKITAKKSYKKSKRRFVLIKKKSLSLKIKKSKNRRRLIRGKKRKISGKKFVLEKNSANNKPPAKPFFRAKIRVVGIGGGAGSIVSEIGKSLHKASFFIADTDVRSFRNRKGIQSFLFGQKITHGLGTGLNAELAKTAAEQEKEKILKFLGGQDIVIFIVCLGGGLGSGAAKIFAESAKNSGCITFGIFTLPFKFEGQSKYRSARTALKELREMFNVSITIPNERIFKVIDSNTAITKAFSIVNKNLAESLGGLIDLIYSPGVINIDFADLRAVLKGNGNLAFLNIVETSGKNRADETIKKIFNNPLYEKNDFVAEKILFNIAGGGNLSMFEVDKISREISSGNPKAKIIFGISKNPRYKNSIRTVLLMTGSARKEEVVLREELKSEKLTSGLLAKSVKLISSGIKKPLEKYKDKKPLIRKKDGKKTVKFKKRAAGNQLIKSKEEIKIGSDQKFFDGILPPVFGNPPTSNVVARKLSISESSIVEKKTIRRTALEAKKEQENEIEQKSQQEKEWEIPAFLRFKK